MNGILNVKEVAKLLHIKEDTVRIKLRAGIIRGFKAKGSHLWLVTQSEIERVLSEDDNGSKSTIPEKSTT